MDTVAIIGAGVMGSDVALVCAAKEYNVVLIDHSRAELEKVRSNLVTKLRMYKMLNPELKGLDASTLNDKITYSLDYKDISKAFYVVENVTEDLSVKSDIYKSLQNHCSDNTIFGVNTSCISITKIASLISDPSRVIGVHFMNPVPVIKGVEVMRGVHTSEDTINTTKSFLKRLGKVSILVDDMPGFVANRLSHLFMNEAAFLIQDKVAEPEAVDNIFKMGYGHAMGPLETADLIGLDTVLQSLKVLYDSYQDSKFRSCPLLQKMVDAGFLGRKSGKGFYSY